MSPAPSPVLPVRDAPADVCGRCPHPLSAHDTISLRFCRATGAGDLARGCACPTS
ncbi:RGCVC family protein [Blastococcus aurantiacus]|uniref:RGCVC family protein n=1 Tax=Blastococcus aurantiacus TaxID=1550231 RepID=UPI001C40BAEC